MKRKQQLRDTYSYHSTFLFLIIRIYAKANIGTHSFFPFEVSKRKYFDDYHNHFVLMKVYIATIIIVF